MKKIHSVTCENYVIFYISFIKGRKNIKTLYVIVLIIT